MRKVPLLDVEVRPEPDGRYVCVSPVWGGVDSPSNYGIVCTKANAKRLEHAIRDGVVFADSEVVVANDGVTTYAKISHEVMGKYLNSDLRKLGY